MNISHHFSGQSDEIMVCLFSDMDHVSHWLIHSEYSKIWFTVCFPSYQMFPEKGKASLL